MRLCLFSGNVKTKREKNVQIQCVSSLVNLNRKSQENLEILKQLYLNHCL